VAGTAAQDVDGEHLAAADAFTLNLERDPLLRATIVAVATFDRAPDWSALVDRVERATRLVPRFRQRLEPSPLGVVPPRWVLDADFELGLHLRRAAVPAGGGEDDVMAVARHAAMTAFDHDRPLWEFTLLEGLPDGSAALVMKLHHALTDGVGGIELAAHVVDLEPDPPTPPDMPPAPSGGRHGTAERLLDAVAHPPREVLRATRTAVSHAPRAVASAVVDPIGTLRRAAGTAVSVASFVRPITSTRSPVMRRRRPVRHLGGLDVPLGDLSAAAHRCGGTLNDAYLAAVAGGLRRYHDRHLTIVDRLRVTMPISTRTAQDAPGGNRVTLQRFDLPVGVLDPCCRIRSIGERTTELRHDPAIAYGEAIATVLNLLPVGITAGMLTHVDLLASNVPGFDRPVWVGGARLRAFRVHGATLGSAANVTLLSYAGTCHVGVTTDAGAIEDHDVFVACLREGFDEVIGA
jgi:diacylglycerol O-acyltransferase